MFLASAVAVALSVPASIGMGLEVRNGVDRGDSSGLAVELNTEGVVVSEYVTSDALVLSDNGDRIGFVHFEEGNSLQEQG